LFENLGCSTERAAILELKRSLHNESMKVVEKQKLTSRQLAKLLDSTQSQASERLNGQISQMTADRLIKYLYRLGRQVKVTTTRGTLQGTEVA
jgi:predicted XRE-type DNA-binding protein